MEGTVRFLTIAMLATAATAQYMYDQSYVDQILNVLNNSDKVEKLTHTVYNIEKEEQWQIVSVPPKSAVHFGIKDKSRATEVNCGGGPALILGTTDPMCLVEMNFYPINNNGKEILLLALVFLYKVQSIDMNGYEQIIFNVFEAPDRKDLPDVVYMKLFTEKQLNKARVGKPFSMTMAWLQKILKNGVFKGPKSTPYTVLGTVNNGAEDLYAFPITMDKEFVHKILALGGEKIENGADVKSS